MINIGQYVIERDIGPGGMGAVHRARDRRFDPAAAIKIFHAQFQRDAAFADRFKAEAVIQAKLSHANIVSVVHVIADATTLAMVIREAGGRIDEARALRATEPSVGRAVPASGAAHPWTGRGGSAWAMGGTAAAAFAAIAPVIVCRALSGARKLR